MRITLLSTLVTLLIHSGLAAQVFTIYDLRFERIPILKEIGAQYSATATLSVVRGKPLIKNISSTPSYALADTEMRSFIDQVIFVTDTSDYKLTFVVKVNRKVMNQYSEVSGDTIFLTCPYCPTINRCPVGQMDIATSDESGRTHYKITINDFFHTDSYMHSRSDILVERIFTGGKDSTVIIRNNYPESEKDILRGAKRFSKEDFERRLKLSLGDDDYATIMATPDSVKRYFLDCTLFHNYPCNIQVMK